MCLTGHYLMYSQTCGNFNESSYFCRSLRHFFWNWIWNRESAFPFVSEQENRCFTLPEQRESILTCFKTRSLHFYIFRPRKSVFRVLRYWKVTWLHVPEHKVRQSLPAVCIYMFPLAAFHNGYEICLSACGKYCWARHVKVCWLFVCV